MKIYLNGKDATPDTFALIDDADAELTRFRWHYFETPGYSSAYIYKKTQYMHRVVMARVLGRSLKKGECIDHVNHNKLDNRRHNLRVCTYSQNKRYAPKQSGKNGRPPSSKYKGVSFDKTRNKWMARVKIDRQINLGRFDSEEDAARCYDRAAKKHYGEFANLNFQD